MSSLHMFEKGKKKNIYIYLILQMTCEEAHFERGESIRNTKKFIKHPLWESVCGGKIHTRDYMATSCFQNTCTKRQFILADNFWLLCPLTYFGQEIQ